MAALGRYPVALPFPSPHFLTLAQADASDGEDGEDANFGIRPSQPQRLRNRTSAQLRAVEGTIVMHINFAMKQDHALGKEFISYECPGASWLIVPMTRSRC